MDQSSKVIIGHDGVTNFQLVGQSGIVGISNILVFIVASNAASVLGSCNACNLCVCD